jgi:VWFA-related protein
MRATVLVTGVSVLGLGVLLAGQTPPDQPTFRTGVRLATFDAVVTDDKGRHVLGLTPADFEVVERGKKQTVRQVTYVSTTGDAPGAAAAPTGPALPGTTGLASRDRTSRVLAIVVDDYTMQFRSIVDTRRMLERYLEHDVAPGDLVAILRSSGGNGALQQFTTDRRLLAKAIEKIRWVARVFPIAGPPVGGPRPPPPGADELLADLSVEDTLDYAIRGLESLPGRKAVVFVSEGSGLGQFSDATPDVPPRVRRLLLRANRAGVVIYAIDPRGLDTYSLTAEDDPFRARRQASAMAMPNSPSASAAGLTPAADVVAALQARQRLRQVDDDRRASLEAIARRTGGFAVVSNNDISGGLRRIVDDTQGYYLIGFDSTIDPGPEPNPADVRIRARRTGLQVRARAARFGPADPDRPPIETPTDPLIAATLSPFTTGAIDVRLTSLFGYDATEGPYVRSLVAIDPAGLALATDADGRSATELTLLAAAVGEDGKVIGVTREPVEVRLDAEAHARARERGLRYGLRIPIEKPGGYQIRVAVQDGRSNALGSGAQFVEVPRVAKGRLALAGVTLTPAGAPGAPLTTVFAAGSTVEYRTTVYDGRGNRERGLSTRALVLRDGKTVFEAPPASIAGAAKDAPPVAPVPFRGTLTLGGDLTPGYYTLQVGVAPDDGKTNRPQAMQWIDFEVR